MTLASLALTLGLTLGAPAPAAADSLIPVDDLPLTLMQAPGGSLLAVVITGDGGWASGDKSLAAALVHRNVAVIGLSSPKYLIHGVTPDEAGQDLARILGHFLDAWHRDRALVVGYSRGADIGPFMVSRLPPALRERVALTALLGPGQHASFRFALLDLLHEHGGSRSLPVDQEVAKLRGTPVLCIYGAEDKGAICPALQAAGLARSVQRSGGHAVHGSDGPALVDVILGGVPSSGSESSKATAAATNVITANAQMKQPSATRSNRRLRAGSGERRLE
jgi:type IV secretory pathway VirJ component